MADNRTTVKSDIGTLNIPSVTNANLNTMLQNYMADNMSFLADVAVIQNSSITSITCNFTGKDRIDLTRTGGALNITVSGIADGQTVYLLITKTAGNSITFTGVTDITPVVDYIALESLVLYQIIRKGSNYYALAFNETVKQATTSFKGVVELSTDLQAITGTSTVLGITPANMQAKFDDVRDNVQAWQSVSLSGTWSGNLQYFKDNIGIIHLRAASLKNSSNITGTTASTIGTLPSGYRPGAPISNTVTSTSAGLVGADHVLQIATNGVTILLPETNDYPANNNMFFYMMFRQEN